MGRCIYNLAAAIQSDCDNPLVAGYTGRGVLVQQDSISALVQSASNKRVLENITASVVFPVENAVVTPFDGSNTASAEDGGRVAFTKQVMFRVPQRGADASRDIIEPLVFNANGYLFIAEKKDKVGNGSFEVIGLQAPLKATADGISRNESENGGDTAVTLQCTEQWFECVFFKTDYATTLAAFNALFNASANA